MAAPINPATGQPFPFLYVTTVQRALTRIHERVNPAVLSPGAIDGRWGARTHGSYASWLAILNDAQVQGSYIAGLGLNETPQRVYMPAEGRMLLEGAARAYAADHPAEEVPIPSRPHTPASPSVPLPEASAPPSEALVTAPPARSGIARNSPPETRTPEAIATIATPWYERPAYVLGGLAAIALVAGATWWYFKGRKRGRRRRR